MEDNPFPSLHIASSEFMNKSEGRETCPKCGKSRKYYCYTCFVPVKGIEKGIPHVKLPIKVDIIKHPNECDGKSTAAHAALLAPDDVTVHTYPSIPHYTHKHRVLLVYPSETSVTIEEYAKSHPLTVPSSQSQSVNNVTRHLSSEAERSLERESVTARKLQASSVDNEASENSSGGQKRHLEGADDTLGETTPQCSYVISKRPRLKETESAADFPIDTVVFIDSTWNQVKKIAMDERLDGLQRIELKSQVTRFWRHQRDKPDTYLATVEAVYYFFREFHQHYVSERYEGQYDNLLFLFTFMYKKIKHLYDGGKELKAYKKTSNEGSV